MYIAFQIRFNRPPPPRCNGYFACLSSWRPRFDSCWRREFFSSSFFLFYFIYVFCNKIKCIWNFNSLAKSSHKQPLKIFFKSKRIIPHRLGGEDYLMFASDLWPFLRISLTIRLCGVLSLTIDQVITYQKWESVRSGEREVTGSIPGRDIPKSLKMVLAAPRLALRFTG